MTTAKKYYEQLVAGDYNSFANTDFWMKQVENQPGIFKLRNEKWLPKIEAAMRIILFIF